MSTLEVPGARLQYRARGAGPFVLFVPSGADGAAWDPAAWDPTADALADDHATVTYEPRGTADVETQADDAAALLTALGVGTDAPAHVVGNGEGALVGLALVTRHPGLVHTLIAHEPSSFPAEADAPDTDSLRASGTRVVVTGGRQSRGEPANQAAEAFAEALGEPLTELPGGHDGLDTQPGLFAEALRGILAGK